MHYHVWGGHHAKFDDDDFNTFRGIACEGQTHRKKQTWVGYLPKSLLRKQKETNQNTQEVKMNAIQSELDKTKTKNNICTLQIYSQGPPRTIPEN